MNTAVLLTAFCGAALLAGSASAVAGTDAAVYTPDIGFSSASPVDGSQISVLVTVHNLGDQNATDVIVQVALTSTNELLGSSTISLIGGGAQAETAVVWNISGEGPMTVTVTVQSAEPDVQPENNVAVSSEITVRARPDLRVDSVTFDNNAPPAGTPASTIYVTISNIGGSDATLVHVILYDGSPDAGIEIYNTTIFTGVTLISPVTVAYDWDLAGHGGRHDIYAVVDYSNPAEKAGADGNNWATGRLLVLTFKDHEVFGAETVTASDPLYDGFVIIHSGGSLTFVNSTFTLLQERTNEFDIIVESGGVLTLTNSRIESLFPVGLTIRNGGSVTMREGSEFGGVIASEGGSLYLFNTTVGGDIEGKFHPLWVEDSAVNGALTLMDATASVFRTTITTDDNVAAANTTLTFQWVTLVSGQDPAIGLSAGTTATLAGVDAGEVLCEDSATATVKRMAIFMVSDLTGMPIPGASVTSAPSLGGLPLPAVVTDLTGKAWAWLDTDLLSSNSPQYVGSYRHTAAYLTYRASAVANMAYYPTLTAESNTMAIDLVFEVLNPADIFQRTNGDRTSGTPVSLGDFNQTGNWYISTTLNINGSVMMWQTRDFEAAIVVRSGSVSIGPGGSIRSNKALNIYLYNNSEISSTGGSLAANAIVTFNTASVNLAGVSIPQGSFILNGSSFRLTGDSDVSGTRLYARGATSVIIDGATVAFALVDVDTKGDITVNNATFTSFSSITLRTNASKTLSALGTSIICASGGDAAFEANIIKMEATSVAGCSIVLFSAATVQARDVTFTSTLTGFRPASSATFYDVNYPDLDVVASAVVTIYHKLTIRAVDLNQNAVTAGTYKIVGVPGGNDAGQGPLSAAISNDLEASKIEQGFQRFTGNYRVSVTAEGGEEITRDVVMDNARTEVFFYAREIVAPSSIEVEAAAEPTQVYHGVDVSITGTVALLYPNRAGPMYRGGVVINLSDGATWTATTTTDATGAFNWTGPFSPAEAAPGERQVTVTATYTGVSGSRTVSIEILKPAPRGLIIIVDEDSQRFTPSVGQAFIVHGTVFWTDDAGTPTDPAENVLVQVIFVNPFQPDLPPSNKSDSNGRFVMTVTGRNAPKSYSMNVVARDDIYGFNAPSVGISAVVGATPTGAAPASNLTLYILLAAGLGVAGLVAFLLINAKRKSVNYVECGNCGRPARESDKKCPSCGCEFEEDIAKCSHCASWIPANAVRCPKCNTEFKPVGEALEAPTAAPDKAAPEGVKAEVTTTEVARQPVAVKKKVLKTAEPAAPAPQPAKPADGPKFENPWDQPGDKPTEQGGMPSGPAPPKPAEKKPEEKKEKGLFDDL